MSYVEKIKSWMPRHFTGDDYIPYISMAGQILNELEQQIDSLFDETYISMSNQEFLTLHSQERRFNRISYGTPLTPETLQNWANRVRRVKYNRTENNILLNLESIAPIFNAQVVWDYPDGIIETAGDHRADTLDSVYPSANWGNFGPLDLKKRHNSFSIVIEFPIPPPLAHYDDSKFYDDQAFMDTRERTFDDNTALAVKALIGRKVPAGSGWRLLVKGFNGLTIGDEASQEKELNSF